MRSKTIGIPIGGSLAVAGAAVLLLLGMAAYVFVGQASATTVDPGTTTGDSTDPAVLAANANDFTNVSSTKKLCLFYDSNKCLVSHGVGNQVTIQGTGTTPSQWQLRNANGLVMLQNGSGNCAQGNSDNRVTIVSGACNSSNDAQKWQVVHTNPYRLVNYRFRANHWYLSVFDDTAGFNVWILNPEPGGLWISWTRL